VLWAPLRCARWLQQLAKLLDSLRVVVRFVQLRMEGSTPRERTASATLGISVARVETAS